MDPNLIAYSRIRYYDLLENAANQRQRKSQRASTYNPIILLANRFRSLNRLFTRGQSQAVSDEIAALKS